MKAILRRTRISPQKMNLIASLVRGKDVNDALSYLQYVPKKGASLLYKALHSAASNAENNFNQKKDKLFIKTILVTKGPSFRRFIPISRGRVHPIEKKTSHVTIELEIRDGAAKKEAPKKETAKKAAPKKETTAKKAAPKKKTATKTKKKTETKAEKKSDTKKS